MSALRRFSARCWPLVLAFALGACQPDEQPLGEPSRIDVTIDDLQVMPTPEEVARVVDVQPAGDGRVWLLNALEPFFFVLGPEGAVERRFGARGGGPEEFDDPIGLVRGPSGQVWTFDNLRKAFRPLSDTQQPSRALPTDWLTVSFGNAGMGMVATAPWLESHGEDFLIARKRPSAPPSGALGIWHADVFRVGQGGGGVTLEPALAVPELLGDPGERYPGAVVLMPFPLWTVCGDGTVGLYDPLSNSIRRFASDGGERASLALEEARNETVTFDRVFGMVYRTFSELRPGGQAPDSLQMRGALQQQFTQAEAAFADVFPEYADLKCTDDGTFWIQPYTVTDGRFARSTEWTRFSPDASRTTISFPDAFTVHRIEGDRVWGVVSNELGVPSVAWY